MVVCKFFLFFLSVIGAAEESLKSDSVDVTKPIVKESYPKKNPTVALFLSLLPGGGQFYTENYLKGIIIGGVQLYFGGGTIYLHIKAKEAARKKYKYWRFYHEWYSNQRNNFLWWDALVWAISMADAYVSAHFYKFKEQGKLKLDVGLKDSGYRIGVARAF